jgi:hypothetical protein
VATRSRSVLATCEADDCARDLFVERASILKIGAPWKVRTEMSARLPPFRARASSSVTLESAAVA